jgi:hypothetical protein
MNQVEVKVMINVQDPNQIQALNALFATLAGEQVPQTKQEQKPTTKVTEKPKAEKPKEEQTKQETATTQETAKEEKDEATEIKIEEVRALLAKKVENNRAEIKTKLTALNAPNVTALDKSKYVEFVDFLNGLK